tara:strand:- start:8093 stop:11101 length:3009 start_codon:yes stop_codon:yes gene_type:complete
MSSEEGIHNLYFNLCLKHKKEYGGNVVILLQVGAFFEIYGLKDTNTKMIDIDKSNIVEVTDLCGLSISDKKVFLEDKQIVMAGFRDFSVDKYITILTENGYTVPVYVQVKNGQNITRELDTIYSPGTYFSCDVDKNTKISNNIMCIWIDVYKPYKKTSKGVINKEILIYGLSVVNIYTGESYIFQYETIFNMIPSTFDELQRYISTYSPCEVIIISSLDKNQLDMVVQFSDIHSNSIHYVDNRNKELTDVQASTSQKYIREMVNKYFGEESYEVCDDFSIHIVATQSYVYLLNFIEKHSINLLKKISLPVFYNTSDRVILANHTLSQLNIINSFYNESNSYGKLSSVLSFLNNCCSPMGKRKVQFQITNPTFNEKWLAIEYDITDYLLNENYNFIEIIRKQMKQIKDMDKMTRQIVVKKIYPATVYNLYIGIQSINELVILFQDNTIINDYLVDETNNKNILLVIEEINVFINKYFIIDMCSSITSMNIFEENIINTGVCRELDNSIIEYENKKEQFEKIKNFLNNVMRENENNNKVDFVRIHETEKSGFTLQITNNRSRLLTKHLQNMKDDENNIYIDSIIKFSIDDLKYIKSSASNVDISIPILNDIIKGILKIKSKINELITVNYLDILDKMNDTILENIEIVSKYAAKLDVLQNKVYVAKKYNYCKPIIDDTVDKSYVNAKDIRHCLIEHLQQNEIYVTNDISLGEEKNHNGILLYGTNAVGKTSLIRALGVSIIMAQSGFYVPCSEFIYKPYTAIFSRILSNDNLFKGLSTFAVEMSELRVILKMADENSLVLGDELCSGTETQSAISIFLAGLKTLHLKQSSFIFATHFHEIVEYEEIHELTKMILQHMEVQYNKLTNALEYDRKLKDGSGPKSYGLEVCKSLYLEDDFIELAYFYRNKYYPDNKGTLSMNTTHYNAKKIRGICEICTKNIGTEIHHLQHQQDANEDGFIESFHKNHKANLVSICEECHLKMHDNNNNNKEIVTKKKKTTKGYILT